MKTELRNLAHIKKMRQINTYAGSAGLTLGSISFIMVIFITIVLIIFCKVAKDKHDAQNNINNLNTPRPLSNFSVTFARDPESHSQNVQSDNDSR